MRVGMRKADGGKKGREIPEKQGVHQVRRRCRGHGSPGEEG